MHGLAMCDLVTYGKVRYKKHIKSKDIIIYTSKMINIDIKRGRYSDI